MFDPTIYDNLKTVLEGIVYDYDLNGELLVVDRQDLVDLATLERTYIIKFTKKQEDSDKLIGEILLKASVKDLAGEVLELTNRSLGCFMYISFYKPIANDELECLRIEQLLTKIWGKERQIHQQMTHIFRSESIHVTDKITIAFDRKIDEDQIEDFPSLFEHILLTYDQLEKL